MAATGRPSALPRGRGGGGWPGPKTPIPGLYVCVLGQAEMTLLLIMNFMMPLLLLLLLLQLLLSRLLVGASSVLFYFISNFPYLLAFVTGWSSSE